LDTRQAGARGGKSRSKRKIEAVKSNLSSAKPLTTEERRINGRLGYEKRRFLETLAAQLLPHLEDADRLQLETDDLSSLERLEERFPKIPESFSDRRLLARAILRRLHS
jgi:hypothetical protein